MFGLIVIANENPSTKIILFELENSIEKDIELESLNECMHTVRMKSLTINKAYTLI